MSKTPIEMMLDGVTWTAAPDQPQDRHDGPGLPYATHEGIWEILGHSIRVYRLSNGQAIIHADDIWKILGEELQPDAASHRTSTEEK